MTTLRSTILLRHFPTTPISSATSAIWLATFKELGCILQIQQSIQEAVPYSHQHISGNYDETDMGIDG
jgi:hypothetical protein